MTAHNHTPWQSRTIPYSKLFGVQVQKKEMLASSVAYIVPYMSDSSQLSLYFLGQEVEAWFRRMLI